ncbi:MAG: RNase adapter RapZ [Erysipelotrichia bacterium]|jgi:UPF0042 nucleotide-binding protein|nr:RNase adapter RapZ [Erysipelotrichia bacterium]
MIDLVILTGVSGAGKSTAVRAFEEMDYYIVENVPLSVIPKLYTSFQKNEARFSKTLVVVSINESLKAAVLARKIPSFNVTFMALDATEAELITRFRLTRHLHPQQAHGLTLEQCLKLDRKIMDAVKSEVDIYIDTTGKTVPELRKYIFRNIDGMEKKELTVNFVSFGFKHGVPADVEIIFDTRIVPNPYWIPELKELTGEDKEVQDFVLNDKDAKLLVKEIEKYLVYYLKKVKEENRNFFVVGIGCSGGQHRSVAITNYLSQKFSKSYRTLCLHRDLGKYKK